MCFTSWWARKSTRCTARDTGTQYRAEEPVQRLPPSLGDTPTRALGLGITKPESVDGTGDVIGV